MNLNMDSPMDQTYYYDPQYLPPDQCPAPHQICNPPMHYMPAGSSTMPTSSMTPASHPLPPVPASATVHTHPGSPYDMGHMTALCQSPSPMLHSPPQHLPQSTQAPGPASSTIGQQAPLSHDLSGQMSAHYKGPARHFDSYLSHPHSQSIGSPHQVYPQYNNNGQSKNKYITTACPLSSGPDSSLNISGTITHVSETDHSRDHIPSQHNSYPSTPVTMPGKPILNHTTSTPINYPQMSPNSNHNWNGRHPAPQSIGVHSRVGGALVGQPSPNQTPIFENGKISSHYGQYTGVPRSNVNNIPVNNINNDALSSATPTTTNNNNNNHHKTNNNINNKHNTVNNNNNNAGLEAYQGRQVGSTLTPLAPSIGSHVAGKDGKSRLDKRFASLAQHDKSASELNNNNNHSNLRKSYLNTGSDNTTVAAAGNHNKHSATIEINPKPKSDGISLLSHVPNGPSKSDKNNNNNNNNSNNTNNNSRLADSHSNSAAVQIHNGMSVEKRQITLFKVIEQYIHPVTRTVLKENIVQNVELTTSLGRTNYDADCAATHSTNNDDHHHHHNHNSNASHTESSLLTNGTHPTDTSSAMFADVSALSSRNKSKLQMSVNSTGNANDSSSNNNNNNNNNNTNSSSINKTEPSSSSDDSKTIQIKDEPDADKAESEVSLNPSLSSTASPSQISSSNSSPNECSPVLSPALSTQLDSPTVLESRPENVKRTKDPKISLPNKDSEDTIKSNRGRKKKNSTGSSPSSPFERMRLGMKVLAKWKDKNYYPAEVMKQLAGNKWSVKFDDFQTKNVFENEVVRLEYLSVNQEIMLSTSHDTCVKATILKIYSKNIKTLEFDLEHFENGKDIMKRYRLGDVFLNSDQGAEILNRTGHKKIISKNSSESVFADVDLDNIVSGKRSRSNKVELKSSKKTAPDPENPQQQQQQQQPQQSQPSSSESDAPVRKKRKVTEKNSQQQQQQQTQTKDEKSKKSENVETKSKKQDTIGESKIFQKCSFLIVDVNDDCLLDDKQFSGGEQIKATLKEHLTKVIRAGQGHVFETFQKMKKATQLKNCYLLSKSFNTSLKYFQCLASGVPLISHLWIVESSRSNKLLDRNSFVLPSGFSIVNDAAITELSLIQASHGLFKDTKIYCKTDIEHGIVDILKASDAIVLLCKDDNDDNDFDDIFKDDTKPEMIIVECCKPSDKLVKRANDSNIPILKRDYILQCLINGRKLSFDEQPNFTITL